MAAALLQCTKEELCAVIRFLWSAEVKIAEIHRRMLLHYGDNFLAQRRVYEWLELLRNSRISVVDEQRPCRHRAESTEGYAEIAEELIRANRRVRVDETADTLAIGTVLCLQYFTRSCNS
jgi:hypothetical protein